MRRQNYIHGLYSVKDPTDRLFFLQYFDTTVSDFTHSSFLLKIWHNILHLSKSFETNIKAKINIKTSVSNLAHPKSAVINILSYPRDCPPP